MKFPVETILEWMEDWGASPSMRIRVRGIFLAKTAYNGYDSDKR